MIWHGQLAFKKDRIMLILRLLFFSKRGDILVRFRGGILVPDQQYPS